MILRTAIVCLFISLFSVEVNHAYGQSSDEELANYYFDTGEFDKALLYYEKIYTEKPSNAHYRGLLKCQMELQMYKESEKLIKRQMKRFGSNLLYIDLGKVYEAQDETKDADDAYRDAIQKMPKSQGTVIRTANEFIRMNKLNLALDTYNYGKKLLDGAYPFSYELASLYGTMGDTELMITSYLDLIEFNDAYLQTVQNALNRSINFENDFEKVELLRTELLRRVQKSPQNTVYSQMLIWLFLQQKEFNSAYVQLKAIDKRLGEDGHRLLNLASLCMNNQAYDVAEKSYEYIVEKGPDNPYYPFAKAGILKARFETIRSNFPPDSTQLILLKQDYEQNIADLQGQSEVVGMMRQKAVLEAYYLSDFEAANVTLNDALDLPGIHPDTRSEIKLDLAEILIARDYIWDASLLCSQVDKDYKNDILGYRAKFLNAEISYYAGDFSWAQAQLDVLKGSTSKLISNDAMELSLLITDNMNLDTIMEPMLMFARADLMIVQRQYETAISAMDSILTEYPGHALSDEILMRKAQIAEEQYDFEQAISYYQSVVANHYFDITADNALYEMALIYEEKLGDEEKAKELYKQLLVDFPGSLFVVDARKRFRALRGDGESGPAEITPIEKNP